MLTDLDIHPTLATADAKRARQWFADKIGWQPVEELTPVGVRAGSGGDGQRGPQRTAALHPDPAGGRAHGAGGS